MVFYWLVLLDCAIGASSDRLCFVNLCSDKPCSVRLCCDSVLLDCVVIVFR